MPAPRIKLLLLILLPILVGSTVVSGLVINYARAELDARALAFGNAIADQLVLTITDPLVRQDTLRLNVTLNNLLARNNFSVASVYGPDGRLVAQAGKGDDSQTIISRDVTLQDAAAGSLQIGLDRRDVTLSFAAVVAVTLLVHLFVFVSAAVVIWFYGDFLLFWVSAPASALVKARAKGGSTMTAQSPAQPDQTTVLVAKIRPVRQLAAYKRKILSALELYPCEVEESEGGDIVLSFVSADQVFEGVCAGQLLTTITQLLDGNIKVRLGLHTAQAAEATKARKHATYLASIAEDNLLASKQVIEQVGSGGRMDFREHRSSLAPDGEVYYLKAINAASQAIVDRQARQLS